MPDASHRFTWIVPDRIIGMALPTDVELEQLARLGVRHLISLTMRPLDEARLAALGLVSHHMPLPDMSAPDLESIRDFVDKIEELLEAGERTAVHCGAGLGRTGTMLACFLVHLGVRAGDAIDEIRRQRPGSVESREQEIAVMRYEESLRG